MADGKRRMVYSTAVIDQLIREANDGYEIDYSAFYNRDTTLRAANLVFEMTQQEMDEYMKCYEDPLYYTSNYCKFKTDNDAQLVTLRPYQEKVIKIVTAEEYNDEIDDIVPKYKNLIWLASRQVGKCLIYNTLCNFKTYLSERCSKHISLGDKYYTYGKKTFLVYIKKLLYKIYDKL